MNRSKQIQSYLGIKEISNGFLPIDSMYSVHTVNDDKVTICKELLTSPFDNIGYILVLKEGEDYKVLLGSEWVVAADELGLTHLWVNVADSDVSPDIIENIKQKLALIYS